MNKMKSRKLLTSRLRITKNGKILRRQSFRRHLKASKSAKRLNNLSRTIELLGYYAKKVRKATGTSNKPKTRYAGKESKKK